MMTPPEVEYCPACHGSGESMTLEGGGPYAYEMPCNCPHCNGTGALIDAYKGVVVLLAEANRKYMELCGKQWAQATPVLPNKDREQSLFIPVMQELDFKIEVDEEGMFDNDFTHAMFVGWCLKAGIR